MTQDTATPDDMPEEIHVTYDDGYVCWEGHVPEDMLSINMTKYIRADVAHPPQRDTRIDVEALYFQGDKDSDRFDEGYRKGWNACVRDLNAKGLLSDARRDDGNG